MRDGCRPAAHRYRPRCEGRAKRRVITRSRVLVSACLLAAAACDAGPHPERAPDALPPLAFSDTTLIGGMHAEGPAAFGRVRAAIFDGAGRIVVADGQSQELLRFSESGAFVDRFGGRGGGPGEHRAIRALWPLADGGFCTWDVQTLRATRFGPDGAVVGASRADVSGLGTPLPTFRGFLDGCAFVLEDEPSNAERRDMPEGNVQDTVGFVLFDGDGAPMRTLARVADAEKWFRNRDGGWGRVSMIFGGELFALPLGGELWVGLSSEPSWARYTLEGEALEPVRLPDAPRPATEAEVQAERDRRLAEVRAPRGLPPAMGGAAERMAEQMRAGIREVAARDSIPPYDRAVVGTPDRLWLRRHPHAADSHAEWVLLAATAEPIGVLALPREDEILYGSEARVIISSRDAMDAPLLRILRR